MYVLRIMARADGATATTDPNIGRFIRDFDPSYGAGRGLVTTTEHRRRAKRFPDEATAFDYWRQTPSVRPTRDDGQPNRPLTAYTVVVEPHQGES